MKITLTQKDFDALNSGSNQTRLLAMMITDLMGGNSDQQFAAADAMSTLSFEEMRNALLEVADATMAVKVVANEDELTLNISEEFIADSVDTAYDIAIKAVQIAKTIKTVFFGFFAEVSERAEKLVTRWTKSSKKDSES